jgi:hypothetical protein
LNSLAASLTSVAIIAAEVARRSRGTGMSHERLKSRRCCFAGNAIHPVTWMSSSRAYDQPFNSGKHP